MICGFIDAQRVVGHRVELICRVLREQGLAVTPRSYRSWKAATSVPARVVSDAAVLDVLRGLKTGGPDGGPLPEVLYGRRKMTSWLRRNGFPDIGKRTVNRLMRVEGMNGVVRGARTRTTIGAKPGADKVRAADLLKRNFRTGAPNRAWVTDFTYVATWAGFVYVAFAIDLFSRAAVGWSIATVKDVAFVEACLSMALWRRDQRGRPVPAGMVHHSDAGSTPRSGSPKPLSCTDSPRPSEPSGMPWTTLPRSRSWAFTRTRRSGRTPRSAAGRCATSPTWNA